MTTKVSLTLSSKFLVLLLLLSFSVPAHKAGAVAGNTLPQAYNLTFTDRDNSANKIGGQLHWKGPNPDTMTVSYSVYFVTRTGDKITWITSKMHGSDYDFTADIPNGTVIPSLNGLPAQAIGVFAVDAAGHEGTNPAIITIWDAPYTSLITLVANFLDTNPNEGAIMAELRWAHAALEANISQYTISYNDSSFFNHIIAQVDKQPASVTDYTYTLTSSQFAQIPNYVTVLFLRFNDLYGNPAPIAFILEISDLSTNKTSLSATVNENLSPPTNLITNAFHNSNSQPYPFIGWYNPANSTSITDYEIYFLDKTGRKLGSLATIKKSGYDNELYIPSNIVPPSSSAKLGVFSKDSSGAESKKYAVLPLYDNVHETIKSNQNKVGIDDIMKFINGDGIFSQQDIKFLLGQIDPIVEVGQLG